MWLETTQHSGKFSSAKTSVGIVSPNTIDFLLSSAIKFQSEKLVESALAFIGESALICIERGGRLDSVIFYS
jgi:hypothetical protein